MDTLLQDLRYAIRTLNRSRGFTAAVVLTLGLGIGANAAIFSIVDGVLLRPLPYGDAERIVTLWQTNTGTGDQRLEPSPANFIDWRERSRSFENMVGIQPYGFDLTGEGTPEHLDAWLVTDGFFQLLDVPALLGRTLLPADYTGNGPRVVVISQGLWQRRFGGDRDLIGKNLELDGEPATVVGVMPPTFRFPSENQETWAPLVLGPEHRDRRRSTYWNVIARLEPGVTIDQARSEMAAIGEQLKQEYPELAAELDVVVVPLGEQLVEHVRSSLLVLLGAVGFVLLIACVNVANLLLARAAGRQRELAIRAALGAGRGQLIRRVWMESLLLALYGGSLGILLAYWGVDLIVGLSPEILPRAEEIGIDLRVLSFAIAVSVLTAALVALVPALRSSRPDLHRFLADGPRGGSSGSSRRRFRNVLVITETALAVVLLIGAGLLVRSFAKLMRSDPGFVAENLAAMTLFVFDRPPPQRLQFFEQAMAEIETLPGVTSVGAVSTFPFAEGDIEIDVTFAVLGRPEPGSAADPVAYLAAASPGYFPTMGIPLVRGRAFVASDRADAPQVVLINETMARRYWPNEDPIGERIELRYGEPIAREIVGIVGDVRHEGLDSDPRPEAFLPLSQYPSGSMTVVVRTAVDPDAVISGMRSRIWELNPSQTIYETSTIDQMLSRTLRDERFYLILLGAFALLALLLAAIGIFGLVSYSTRERTQEFGIRVALGADSGSVVRLMLRDGVLLAIAGVLVGLIGAVALTRLLGGLLFGVTPTDPITFVVLGIIVVGVAALASYIPARRAGRVDPVTALRAE
ncbi:MAG: ABC transporter permease [Gemmatimonadaceae bacterium]